METATEIMIGERGNEYYSRIKAQLAVVLDFVERHNKQDAEREVAQAAQFLEQIIKPKTAPKN